MAAAPTDPGLTQNNYRGSMTISPRNGVVDPGLMANNYRGSMQVQPSTALSSGSPNLLLMGVG